MIFQSMFLLSSFVFASVLPMEDLDTAVQLPEKVAFVPHEGKGNFDNWLAVNIAFAPIEELRKKIEAKLGKPLQHRSEAHITVISPIEWQALAPLISMRELNQTYGKRLQKTKFRVLCLGKFGKAIEGQLQETYFVVVQSEQLLEIRQNILNRFVAKGGDRTQFDPLEYFPHITVGFTSKDLHLSDGALKDVRACTTNLRLRPR
jgi:2'-5' RNA ligase